MIQGFQEEIGRYASEVSDLNGKVFYQEAPTNQAFPYMTYFEVNNDPDDDSSDEMQSIYIQFDFWGKTRQTAFALYIKHESKMKNAKSEMIVDGYTITNIQHTIRGHEPPKTDDIWHVLSEYRFDIQKN